MKKMFGKAKRILIASLVFVFTFSLLTPAVPVFAAQGLTIDLKSSALGSGENVFWGVDRYDSNANSSLIKLQTYNAGTYTDKFRVDTSGNVSALGDVCGNGKCLSSSASQWTTNGSNIYYNSGNVGIGATNPGYPLDLYKASSETGVRMMWGSSEMYLSHGGWSMGAGKLGIGDGAAPSIVVVAATDNVGIGTTNPNDKLEVTGNARFGTGIGSDSGIGIYSDNSTSGYARIRYYQAGTNTQTIHFFNTNWQSGGFWNNSAGAININGATGGGVTFGGWNAPDAAFATGGNVYIRNSLGIGTTAPGYKLDVNGTSNFSANMKITPQSESWGEGLQFYMPTASTWGGLRWVRNRSNYYGSWYIGYTALDSSNDLVFGANNSGTQVDNILRMTTAGNVGVGTASPGAKFDVSGTSRLTNGTGDSWFPYSDGNSYISGTNLVFRANGNTEYMRLASNGNVGIGTSNPYGKLHINGGHLNLGGTSDPSNDQGNNWITWGYRADGNPYYAIRTNYKTYGSYTYSRLQLGWHTGVEIGAASSYGGTRFYNNSPFTGSQIMSIGDGDDNIRIANNLYVGGLINGGIGSNFGTTGTCCAVQTPTLSISEATSGNNRLPWIQFHTSGFQEAFLRLAKDTRVFEMGDGQGVGVDLAVLNGSGSRNVYLSPRGNSYLLAGNVGIGTASPAYKLDVNGQLRTTDTITAQGRVYANSGLDVGNTLNVSGSATFSSPALFSSSVSSNSWMHSNGDFSTSANLSASGSVYSGGNYTINNTSPTIYLQDTDHRSAMIHNNSNLFYVLRGCGNNSTSWCTYNGMWPLTINLEDNSSSFGGAISASGNIYSSDSVTTGGYMRAMGSIYSYGTLYSYGDIYATGGLTMPYGNITTSDGTIEATAAGAYDAIRGISSSANQSGVYGRNTNGSGFAGYFYGRVMIEGAAYSSSGAWSGSDVRWKKNIAPLQGSLDKVLSLRGVSFDWNTKDYPDKNFKDGKQIGFIAQEVEKVVPEVVSTDEKGYKSLSYDKLTAVLVEAVKEQQKQIEELKAEVQKLKAR